jgi:indolepyruvate decarboxylase
MNITIAEFIALRLKQFSCHHVFGIPGTSCSGFIDVLEKDIEMEYILTVNELEAGYMADGYGRQGSIGAVCVAYGVGTLSLANAVASALTERVPFIVINGGPTAKDYRLEDELGVLFAHSTGFGTTDLNVFEKLTVDAGVVKDVETAATIIDRLFNAAIEKSGPVYLEIPQDFWDLPIGDYPDAFSRLEPTHSPYLYEIAQQTENRLREANNPIVLLGSELVRMDMADQALAFIENQQLPFFTTLLSKSLISEDHPLFRGVYDSDLAPSDITVAVESADMIISFGCVFGIDHRFMVQKQYMNMHDFGYGLARIGKQKYTEVFLPHVLTELNMIESIRESFDNTTALLPSSYEERRKSWIEKYRKRLPTNWHKRQELSHDAIFRIVDKFFSKSDQSFFYGLDTCLASFPGADVPLPEEKTFLANPVWLSIGQGTPATAGAYFATKKRPFIVTGDGGFQMVSQTFSTLVRYNIPAIIIIIDNGSYAIEQFLIDGEYFTDLNKAPLAYTQLNPWKYENMPSVYNGGHGFRANTKRELRSILRRVRHIQDAPVVIAATVSDRDLPAENLAFLNSL